MPFFTLEIHWASANMLHVRPAGTRPLSLWPLRPLLLPAYKGSLCQSHSWCHRNPAVNPPGSGICVLPVAQKQVEKRENNTGK